ncbi:unnamed protein product [Microthlaspi erraticum]|uniref:Ubiquitin-like protease family profile domain-containing protein n=1 Tax=Microthlaspi erraticum TaxID=1685480 RepID=A0A6D2IS21_9BRAS|nr:unnamed protein product [Microthlaspi erraticum]
MVFGGSEELTEQLGFSPPLNQAASRRHRPCTLGEAADVGSAEVGKEGSLEKQKECPEAGVHMDGTEQLNAEPQLDSADLVDRQLCTGDVEREKVNDGLPTVDDQTSLSVRTSPTVENTGGSAAARPEEPAEHALVGDKVLGRNEEVEETGFGDCQLHAIIDNIISDGRTPQLRGQTLDSMTTTVALPVKVQTSQVGSTRNMTNSFGVPSMYNVWPMQSASLMVSSRNDGDGCREKVSHASLFREPPKVFGRDLSKDVVSSRDDCVDVMDVEAGTGTEVMAEGDSSCDRCGQPHVDDDMVDADMPEEAVHVPSVAMDVSGTVAVSTGPAAVEETAKAQAGEEDVDYISVGDSSPPPQRAAHRPSEMETELANAIREAPVVEQGCLFPETDPQVFDLFKKTLSADRDLLHILQDKYDLDNTFFFDLSESQKWISTKHMEVLMSYLGAKHSEVLAKEQSSFASPWLISHLQGKYRKFKAAINKEKVRWDEDLKKFVMVPGQTWLEEVHTIYAPMIWEDRHWVGLAIHLGTRFVEVLDPFPSLYADRKVKNFMGPVVDMLPHILSNMCPSATQRKKPFTYARVPDIYENTRAGDCGPVAVKFLEMHAYNDPAPQLAGITDVMVDEFRKSYAVELYRELVVPLYFPPSSQ